MALEVEGVVDGSVHAQKALSGSGRFEALQLALASSHHLMRVLRPMVHSQPLFVRAGQPQSPERRGVRAQLVGHQQFLSTPTPTIRANSRTMAWGPVSYCCSNRF